MGGGILNGVFLGLMVSGVVLAAMSLSTPLAERPEALAVEPSQTPAQDEVTVPLPAPASAPVAVADPGPGPQPDMAAVPPADPVVQAPDRPDAMASLDGAGAEPSVTLPRHDVPPAANLAAQPATPPEADRAPRLPVVVAVPAVAAFPDPPAPTAPSLAPNPSFSVSADASAGGPAPRRLAPPQAADRLLVVHTDPAPIQEPAPEPEPEPEPDSALPADPVPPDAAATAPVIEAPRALPQVPPGPRVVLPDLPTTAPRLPQAGVAADGAATAPPSPDAPNALRDHAVAFDPPVGSALMAVILIDDPESPLDPVALAGLSFPISFAIDPLRADAAERADALRAAGHEVVILGASAIAPGATAADVAVALDAARATLPQAVALMDDTQGRIQSDRPVLEATVGALADTGHGLIAFPRGLNVAQDMARRADVPAATVFRLLDDEDQRAPVITRYLGRAAFAAVQDGTVIVVGRSRPDTVTAVFSWALSGRAEGVALAPVSAVLLKLAE